MSDDKFRIKVQDMLDQYQPRCGHCRENLPDAATLNDRYVGMCNPCAESLIAALTRDDSDGTGSITYEQVSE